MSIRLSKELRRGFFQLSYWREECNTSAAQQCRWKGGVTQALGRHSSLVFDTLVHEKVRTIPCLSRICADFL